METTDELLECLRRKGCPLTVARLADELKKAPQVIEANLNVLRRAGVVQILRPGEWELAPEKLSTEPLIPPEPPSAIARARPITPQLTTEAAAAAITEERRRLEREPRRPLPVTKEITVSKSKRTCIKCKQEKGATGFPKGGGEVCRLCTKGRKPKPQGVAVTTKKKTNGAVRSLRQIRAKHVKPNGAGLFAGAIEHLEATRDKLLGDVAKIDAAIVEIKALG